MIFAFVGIAVKKIEAHCNAVAYAGRVEQQSIPTIQPVLLIFILVVCRIYTDLFSFFNQENKSALQAKGIKEHLQCLRSFVKEKY